MQFMFSRKSGIVLAALLGVQLILPASGWALTGRDVALKADQVDTSRTSDMSMAMIIKRGDQQLVRFMAMKKKKFPDSEVFSASASGRGMKFRRAFAFLFHRTLFHSFRGHGRLRIRRNMRRLPRACSPQRQPEIAWPDCNGCESYGKKQEQNIPVRKECRKSEHTKSCFLSSVRIMQIFITSSSPDLRSSLQSAFPDSSVQWHICFGTP